MKKLLIILGLSLGLVGCGVTQADIDKYTEVTLEGEYVSETNVGIGYGVWYSVYKHDKTIWLCLHEYKTCEANN